MTLSNAASPLILFATMSGNTEEAAHSLEAALRAERLEPEVMEMRSFDPAGLAGRRVALLLTSTFGNGEPPDPAYSFWAALLRAQGLDLRGLRYAVLALGDSSYPRFCQFGADLDDRLAALGGERLVPVCKCDVDWEADFEKWAAEVVEAVKGLAAV